ncbi:hypothetical protein [Desulfosporosinus sp. FKB]|uniref:hypothetical protein n=1 Tax=Desulfosporosinus sp. FKB TaxID=1969835 RepID=UPI000B4A4521|nr:hypothetical protein [Desulfosporosinus sp. FKB]
MNYQQIAELVHKLVKNPKSPEVLKEEVLSEEVRMNEFTCIQKVFSKLEVSGDILTFEITPLDFWG